MKHVFFSGSRDTCEDRQVAQGVLAELSTSWDVRISAYDFVNDPRIGSGVGPVQSQIMPEIENGLDLVICLVGERIGMPLPPNFELSEQTADFIERNERLRQTFVLSEKPGLGQIRLTGIISEVLTAQAHGIPVLFFCKGRRDLIFQHDNLDVFARRLGMGVFHDKVHARDAPESLRRLRNGFEGQLVGVADFYKEFGIKGQNTYVYENAAELTIQLRTALEKMFGIDRALRMDGSAFKGLGHFDIGDRDLFKGRDHEIKDIFDILSNLMTAKGDNDRPILALTGQSGLGKSSLLRAGLAGTLEAAATATVRSPLGGRYIYKPVILTPSEITVRLDERLAAETGERPPSGTEDRRSRLWAVAEAIAENLELPPLFHGVPLERLEAVTPEHAEQALHRALLRADAGLVSAQRRPFLGLDQFDQALAETDAARRARINARWRGAIQMIDRLCRSRAMVAVLCIAHNRTPSSAASEPDQLPRKEPPSAYAVWRDGDEAKGEGHLGGAFFGLQPVTQYNLIAPNSELAEEAFKHAFARAGVDLSAGAKSYLRRLSNHLDIGALLPLFSVAMYQTAANRETRLEERCHEERQRDGLADSRMARRGQAAADTWVKRYLSAKDLQLQATDFVPIEGAIDTLAEDTLAAFIQEDFGLRRADKNGARRALSKKALGVEFETGEPCRIPWQVQPLLDVLFRWLLIGPSPLDDMSFRRQSADRQELIRGLADCIERTEETTSGSPSKIAGALIEKFLAARLMRISSRTRVEFAHNLLLENWIRLRAWIDAERKILLDARELYEFAKTSFQDGGDSGWALASASYSQIQRWARVFARWGVRSDWPILRHNNQAVPVREWLQARLLVWGLEASTADSAETAFWTMIAARDDTSAAQLVRAYAASPGLKTLLNARTPLWISDRQAPVIVLASHYALPETSRALAELCTEPFATDRHGHSVFHFAAAHDDVMTLRILRPCLKKLRKRRDHSGKTKIAWPPAAPSNNGWSALHFAVRSGSYEAVREIISAMLLAPIRRRLSPIRSGNDRPFQGATALHLAARRHRPDAVKVINEVLRYSNEVGFDERDVIDDANALPVHHAAHTNNAAVIARLLKGRRLDHRQRATMFDTSQGDTPIVIAARRGCAEALKKLIDCDAIQKLGWDGGGEALRLAAGYGQAECVRILLKRGSSRSLVELQRSTDAAKRTALHLAAQFRRVNALKLLLAHRGAVNVINTPDELGRTPLHLAADYKATPEEYDAIRETLNLLLEKGADPKERNGQGLTAFGVAAASRLDVAYEMLLDKGAEGSVTLEDVFAAFDMRKPRLNRRLLEEILANTPPSEFINQRSADKRRTLLHGVAFFGDFDACVWLVDKAPELVYAMDGVQHTPLHQAALGGHSDVITLLAGKGAELTAQNTQKRTALHLAAYADRLDAAKSLLAEAKRLKLEIVDLPDAYGKTALHCAAEVDAPKIAEALLAAGANPLSKTNEDAFGRAPAHIAAFYGARSILEQLADREGALEADDAFGGGILHAAASGGRAGTLAWLREKRPELIAAQLERTTTDGRTPLSVAINRYSRGRTEERETAAAPKRFGFHGCINASAGTNSGVRTNSALAVLNKVQDNFEDQTLRMLLPTRRASATAALLAIHDLLNDLDRAGARPDARSVYEALWTEDAELLDQLLERSAEIVLRASRGAAGSQHQPIHLAVSRRDKVTIEKLLKCDASARWEARDARGQTPLHLAAHLNYSELIDLLTWNGPWWQSKDARGNSPFTVALANNSILAFDVLSNHPSLPADVDPSALTGEDAVIARASRAASNDDLETLQASLRGHPSEELLTHVMIAAARAGAETVAGWVHEQDPQALYRSQPTEKPLKTRWQTDPALCQGLRLGHSLTVRLAGENALRARLRERYSSDNTLLHFSAFGGLTDICALLIDLDAAQTAGTESDEASKPLVIPLMNIRNRTKETSFMHAALGLRPETMRWFLRRAATENSQIDLITERDVRGQTALHRAAYAKLEPKSPFYEERRERKRETINALIDAEADPLAEDRDGKMPADIARENGDLESAEYLERISTDRISGAEPMIKADPHQLMGLREASGANGHADDGTPTSASSVAGNRLNRPRSILDGMRRTASRWLQSASPHRN